MKIFFSTIALCFMLAVSSYAAEVIYTYEDNDLDETFNVFAMVTGGSNGLATYNVKLEGLDASPLDPATFSWAENVLSNLRSPDFASVGFQGPLLEGPIGTNAYSATNTQFGNANAMFGVGQIPIFVEAAIGPADNFDIDLDINALLGQLTLPGANALSMEELEAVLSGSAALFTGTDVFEVENPTSISIILELGMGGENTPPTFQDNNPCCSEFDQIIQATRLTPASYQMKGQDAEDGNDANLDWTLDTFDGPFSFAGNPLPRPGNGDQTLSPSGLFEWDPSGSGRGYYFGGVTVMDNGGLTDMGILRVQVPEPGTFILAGLSLVGIFASRRRKI